MSSKITILVCHLRKKDGPEEVRKFVIRDQALNFGCLFLPPILFTLYMVGTDFKIFVLRSASIIIIVIITFIADKSPVTLQKTRSNNTNARV